MNFSNNIKNFINVELRNKFKYREKYTLHFKKENNKILILSLFKLSSDNLINKLIKDRNKFKYFHNKLLYFIKDYDSLIIDLKIVVNKNKFRGFEVTLIRDNNLKNTLQTLPNDMILQILSFSAYNDIVNFCMSCKNLIY